MIGFNQRDFNNIRKDMGISGAAMHKYQNIQSIQAGYINPSIIEERQLNVASMDVFSRLMMDRIIFFGTSLDEDVSNIITAQLLYLSSVDEETDISMYVNSPGGSVYGGYAILDTMDYIKPDVSTIVTSLAASMGFMVAINGTKGKRRALKHSRLMQHQPLGQASGQSSDIQIQAKQIQLVKDELYAIIAERTGQSIKKINKDADRDYWMTSYEAKDYGAIDHIIGVD